MEKEELKNIVKKVLEDLGAKDVQFKDIGLDKVVAIFNWEKIVSFKAEINGWKYTGIQLDSTKERQYKIEFYL